MADFIPPYLGEEVKSNAEKKVFEKLKELNLKNAYILHSLGLPRHKNKIYGEVDFVVLCEKGIACLEIKGGRIECTEGEWIFEDRYGQRFKKPEGPFAQVSGNMFSLRNVLQSRFKQMNKNTDIPVAYGVVFPDIKFTSRGQEIIPEIIYDQGTDNITKYMNEVFDYWKSRDYRKPKELENNEIQSVLKYLRGNFTFIPSLGSRLDDVDKKLMRLTEEQAELMDSLSENDRIVVKGTAGTGKTMLAMDYGRKEAEKGRKVLCLVYNKNLAKELNELMGKTKNVKISTIHGFFEEVLKKDLNSEKVTIRDNNYYNNILPQRFISYFGSLTKYEKESLEYDTLIIDEGQDIVTVDYLIAMDILLKNGMEKGRWAFFYDEEQNIYNREGYADGMEALGIYNYTKCNLKVNCRNTIKIGNYNKEKTGIVSVGSYIGDYGEEVQIIGGKEEDFSKRFEKVIKELKAGGVKLGDITVLSPRRYENSSIYGKTERICEINLLVEGFVPDENKVVFSTIQGFKGLDSKVVILIDLDKSREGFLNSYTYIGISRARSLLYVVG